MEKTAVPPSSVVSGPPCRQPAPPAPPAPPPSRTPVVWWLGMPVMLAGALLIAAPFLGWFSSGLLRDSPDFLVSLYACLGGVTCLTMGFRFIHRPDAGGLRGIITLFTAAAGFGLLKAWSVMVPAKSAIALITLMAIPLLLFPVHMIVLNRCAARAGLGPLNPWRTAGGGWTVILGAALWMGLFGLSLGLMPSGSPAPGPGGGVSADVSGGVHEVSALAALVSRHPLLTFFWPLPVVLLLHWLAVRWLSGKARVWDEGRGRGGVNGY